MITIVSGGQTGVDRGALDAALQMNVPCGGWCPPGRKAEDGPIPAQYPLTEMPAGSYRQRTRCNVQDSDATLILSFGKLEGGTFETQQFCLMLNKPSLIIDVSEADLDAVATQVVDFIQDKQIAKLNVAGPRASKQPAARGIAREVVRRVLDDLAQTLFANLTS